MKRILAVAGLATALVATGAPPSSADTVGRVTLHQNPDHTGPARSLTYVDCPAAVQHLLGGTVGSFTNQPAAGCEVMLVNGTQTHELCAGSGVVPEPFRTASRLRIQPGATAPCTV